MAVLPPSEAACPHTRRPDRSSPVGAPRRFRLLSQGVVRSRAGRQPVIVSRFTTHSAQMTNAYRAIAMTDQIG